MASTAVPASALSNAVVFGDPQLHTDGDLLALTFAPDGTLWSVEEPGVLRHWNAGTGKQVEWHALSDLETQWCFSPDARVLASASNDLTFWDTSSGHVLTAVPQPSWVDALAFHPDPAYLATGHDDGIVRMWDAAGHHLVREFKLHKRPISAVAFSPDGSKLATASEDKTIALWDTGDGKFLGTLTGHTDRIPALAWHPSGDYLVSVGWDTTARIWDIRNRQPLMLLNAHATQVTGLAISADGSRLACGDSALQVHIWDFASKKVLHVLKGPQAEIRCLAFSPDGKRLASSGDGLIHLWDTQTGQALAGTGARPVVPTTLAVSPDGKRLATNGGGLPTRVFNIATHQSGLILQEAEPVQGLAFSPDGRFIFGGAMKHVRVWDANSGDAKAAWDGPEEPITSLAISKDGKNLASASSTGIGVWVWRVADGEPILLIPDALDGCTVEALAFHPQGRLLAVGGIDWLATGGSDGAVCLWDIVDRAEVGMLVGGSTCLAFHPGGDRLVSASLEHALWIWDINSKEVLAEFTGHDATISAVAYSPDGSLIASASEDRTLRLWNSEGDEVALLEVDSQIKNLAFSPDGKFLFTAHGNTTCSQFEVKRLLS
jgi:WD40 repeat protein